MNKGHKATARARSWFFVDQARALLSEVSQGGANIIHPHGNMMNSRPTLFKEPGNRRVFGSCLEQFDARFANRQHGDPNLLFRNLLRLSHVEPQGVAIKRHHVFDSSRCNPDVVDLHALTVVSCRSPAAHPRLNTDRVSCSLLPPPDDRALPMPHCRPALAPPRARAIARGSANAQWPVADP